MSGAPIPFKEEFQLKHLKLHHDEPLAFSRSQFMRKELFMVYRTCQFLYSMGILIDNGYSDDNKEHWFIYLTHWSYLLLTVYFVWQFFMCAFLLKWPGPLAATESTRALGGIESSLSNASDLEMQTVGGSYDKPAKAHAPAATGAVSLAEKIGWAFWSMAAASAIVVTLVYWLALYDPADHDMDMRNLSSHLFNSFQVVIEVMVHGMPIRIMHVWLPQLFGGAWMLFSLIYYAVDAKNPDGERYVYSIVDWGKPGKTIMICAGLAVVGVPLVHFSLYGLYRLRSKLGKGGPFL